MRIVWSDSNIEEKEFEPIRYRKHYVFGDSKTGWTTNIPGDDNIYKNHYCAKNAIDQYLGERVTKAGAVKRTNLKQKRYGIQVIGKQTPKKLSHKHG